MKALKIKTIVKTANVVCHGITPDKDWVLSGFSGSKNVTLPSDFAPSSNPWEMVLKITTGSNVTTMQQIVGGTTSNYGACEFGIQNSKFKLWLGSTSSNNITSDKVGTYVFSVNTTYWIKMAFSGTAYTLSYSLNGKDYTTDITISSTTAIGSSGKALGADRYENQNAFLGSIDLKECYININGERWWSGVVDVEVDKYKVFGVRKRTIKQANVLCYTIAPSDDFVLSGFSSSKYALLPSVPSNVTSYEMVAKFTTGALNKTQQGILANSTTNRCTPQIVISNSNTLNLDHSATSSTWVNAGEITVSTNTTYWAKLEWNGSTVKGYYKTSADADWILFKSASSSSVYWTEKVGVGIDSTELPFNGSIDLKECYININGQRWWSGVKDVQVDKYLITR